VRRRAILAAPALLALPAQAQAWPAGPVRIVAPFAPGGAADTLARFAAQVLGAATGGTFIVENRAGAAGNTGLESVARAAPDGQTFVMAAAAAAINHTLYRNLRFDLLRDFAPVTVIAMVPNVLAVHPALPVRSAQDFVAFGRAQRDGITYGSAGIGTIPNLGMEMLCRRAGITAVHVPFRGSAPAVAELLAGRIQAVFENLPPLGQHIRAGGVRGLAISSAARHPDFPDLPPLSEELGWPDFTPTAWQALVAPAGTPEAIIERVAAILGAALRDPAQAQRIRQMGALPSGMPPAEFRPFLAAEVARWGEVVRSTGATVQ
jgi:tripartite-type tricarboxylate transporter receptor subunit TctC